MTPAATIDVDVFVPEAASPVPEPNWITRTDERIKAAEPIWITPDATADRLASARGALVGITLGAALWVVLLYWFVMHFMRSS